MSLIGQFIKQEQQIQTMRNRYFSPQSSISTLQLNHSASQRLRWIGSTGKLPTYHPDVLQKTIGTYTYDTVKEIGSGYSSKVYKAFNSKDNQEYAVKVIELKKYSPSSLQMLENEIQILKTLDHPNVIKCYDIYKTNSHCYIVTQFCPNGDLLNYLTRRGKLAETVAKEVMSQVLQGLKYLLKCGILHRDLKPANILSNKKSWKIADLGFAIYSQNQIKTRHNVGTPLYMPPQALVKNIYSPQSDIFSFGIIFYELLTGITPWECKSQKQLIKKMSTTPFSLSERHKVSQETKEILAKLCSTDLETRYTKQQFIRLKIGESPAENPEEAKSKLQSSKISDKPNSSVASELLRSTSSINICATSSYPVKQADTKQHKIQTRNNHILINQLHYCRFLYYMTRNVNTFIVSPKSKGKISIILYKHLQKLIRCLSDQSANWFNLSNWDHFKESKKYYTTLLTMKQYSVRYQKQYLTFLKNAEIKMIREINKDLSQLSTIQPFSVEFLSNMLSNLAPIIRQFNHNLTLAINRNQTEISLDLKGSIQGIKSLYKYYQLIKLSMEDFQNYELFEKKSDIRVQIDYRSAANVSIEQFLQLRKALKFV